MARTINNRAVAVAMLMAMAVAVGLLVLLASRPLEAAPRFKIVTRTFNSIPAITIPAGAPATRIGVAAPYPSERSIVGFNRGRILDVNLTLKNFSHTFTRDVDVLLSHAGRSRTVMSDVGGSLGANNITLKLDDEAVGALPDNAQLSGGSFKPTNVITTGSGPEDFFPAPAPIPSAAANLSGFDGQNPNGVWRLWVGDDFDGDSGQFAGGWSITIRARVLR